MNSRNIVKGIEFRVLNDEDIKMIHKASIKVLEEVGIKIEGQRALRLLKENGATITDSNIVKIPHELIEYAINKSPKEISVYNTVGEKCINIDENRDIYFGTGADQFEYFDYTNNTKRPFLRSDIKTICSLVDGLPNLSFILATGVFTDAPAEIACQLCFTEVIKNFGKAIQLCTTNVAGLKDVIEFAVEFAEGKEALEEKPFFIYYAEPVSPLYHPEESTERILLCSEYGIPMVYMPYSMMGGTAPMSKVGAVLQNNVEVLTGLVISQLAKEGSPFIYGAMTTILDMKTQIGSYGSPEFHLCNAASSELAEYYGLPFYGTGAVTDSAEVDYQAVSEIEMEVFSSLLSKANFVHDVGEMEHSKGISPISIVLTNEIIEQLKQYTKGIEVSEESLMLEVISKVGPTNNYLGDISTVKNYKDIWYPKLFSRNISKDSLTLNEKICKEIEFLIKKHEKPDLSKHQIEIITKYERIWEGR